MELAEWLMQQIADDEAVAREAVPSITGWSVGLERAADRRSIVAHLVIPDDSADSSGIASDEVTRTRWLTTAAHIARWHPARVLAECEAKRRIVEEHAWGEYVVGDGWRTCIADHEESPCTTLRLLTMPYADRPGYDPAWRPE